MSLSNYTELKTSIANYLNRNDLTSVIPDFITLTEDRLNRDLRVSSNVVRAETTTTSGQAFYNLPADIIELKNITYEATSSSHALNYLSMESASREYGGVTSGYPRAYTLVGDNLKLLPTPDGAYGININYYKKLSALSDSNLTNDIITLYPALYLFGSCLEGAIYLNDTEQSQRFVSIFSQTMAEVKETEEKSLYAGTVLTMSVQGT
jgi:hypothetical protein